MPEQEFIQQLKKQYWITGDPTTLRPENVSTAETLENSLNITL